MGHPTYTGTIGTNGGHLSENTWEAPRLSQALLYAPVNTFPVYKTTLQKAIDAPGDENPQGPITLADEATFDADLALLLGHVEERLKNGLDEAWISERGYGFAADLDKLAAPAANGIAPFINLLADNEFFYSVEERWARAFTELFVFSAYGGPDVAYFGSFTTMPKFYGSFPSVYPIVVACQHLSTFGVLSRGFGVADVTSSGGTVGCGCSGASTVHLPAFDKIKSQVSEMPLDGPVPKSPPNEEKDNPRQKEAPPFAYVNQLTGDKIRITPGSVVTFNPGGGRSNFQNMGKPGVTHIGSVLRVTGSAIQFIDTGVLKGPSESLRGEAGTSDHAFLRNGPPKKPNGLPEKESCAGVGVLPVPPNLPDAVEKLLAARPLGVVRLAIFDAVGDGGPLRVRFVSKLLHMTYPVSRLVWSLRGLPVKDLSAVWMVYAVKGAEWADALMTGDINMAPATLFSQTVVASNHQCRLLPVNFIRSEPHGQAVVARRKTSPTEGYTEDFGTFKQATRDPTTHEIKDDGLNLRMGQKVLLSLTGESPDKVPLWRWAANMKSFGKRYIDKSGTAGEANEGSTGVAFFDPDHKAHTEITEDAAGVA